MKTTIEVPDHLLTRCRKVERDDGATLTTLIEEGLRLALRAREYDAGTVVEMVPFKGVGLAAPFQEAGWAQIRNEIYSRRR